MAKQEVQQPAEHDTSIATVEDVIRLEQTSPFISAIEQFERQKGKPFETVPYPDKEGLILERLGEMIRIARVNTVWRQRLCQAGVSEIKTWEDWRRIPITRRDDLRTGYTDTKDMLVIPWERGEHKPVASGGSSSEQVVSVYRKREFEQIGTRAGLFWRRTMYQPDEAVTFINLFDTNNGWASHELVRTLLEGVPAANVLPIGPMSTPRIADFWVRQGVTDLAGLPRDIILLMNLLQQKDPKAVYPDVKRAFYGGEFLDPLIVDRVKEVFPNVRLVSVFSSTQADHLAIQVENKADHFRITDDINLIEIVNDEGNTLPYGQTGRIIVTRLIGNGDQPLRLDLEDRGSIELPDSDDPLQARKLKLFGRVGDYVRISQSFVKASDLLQETHNALKGVIDMTGVQARQIRLDNAGIHLKLAVTDPAQQTTINSETQRDLMQKAVMRAQGFFEDEHSLPPSMQLTIEFVTMDQLEKTTVGKIHPFVDRREMETK